MNSTKLFNMNYFLQNVKKSKTGIILAALVLPLFTLLDILLFGSEGFTNCMNFTTLRVFHIFFMYVIPIILSLSLFSYVYKKN